MSTRQYNPTEGRVYGGDCVLIHIADGERADMGAWLAARLDQRMRLDAIAESRRTESEAESQDLCPGCYMVVLFNAAVELAKHNRQSLRELGASMAAAFQQLVDNPNADEANIESIGVVLDPHEPQMSARDWESHAIAHLMTSGGAAWVL